MDNETERDKKRLLDQLAIVYVVEKKSSIRARWIKLTGYTTKRDSRCSFRSALNVRDVGPVEGQCPVPAGMPKDDRERLWIHPSAKEFSSAGAKSLIWSGESQGASEALARYASSIGAALLILPGVSKARQDAALADASLQNLRVVSRLSTLH